MDTPIFDGVLGDRLAAARESVERAERDGRAFAAALSQDQARALDQLAQSRAEALVRERTAALTAQLATVEAELRRVRDAQAVRPPTASVEPAPTDVTTTTTATTEPAAATAPAPASGPDPAPAPTAPTAPPAPSRHPGVRRPAASTPLPAGPVRAATPEPPARIARPAPVRTGRLAPDAGPTGEDVPAVPSMKDIFASSRAAGWLDSLLGARR